MKPKKAKKVKAVPWFKKCNLRSVNCCTTCKHICTSAPVTCMNPKNNTTRSLNISGRGVNYNEICDYFEPFELEDEWNENRG